MMVKSQTKMMLYVSPPVVLIQTPSAPTLSCDLTSFVSAPGDPLQDILDALGSRSSKIRPVCLFP